MRRGILLLTLMGALLLAFGGVVLAQQGGRTTSEDDSPSYRGQDGQRFEPGKLIVKLKDGATQDDLEELNRRNGARTDKEELAPNLVPGLHRISLPQGLAVRDAVGRYKASGDVEYAEPDFTRDADQTDTTLPTDPYYKDGTLWGLNNTGQNSGTVDADIDEPEAWQVTTGGDPGVVVAVIDSGVDHKHSDLSANIWTNTKEIANNNTDDDGNGYVDDVRGYDFSNNDADPMDDNGHGTHVAGTIAAANNNAGVVGVNWTAEVMPLKFLSSTGSGSTSNAIRAVDYAVANGAKLTNNSWGGGGYSQALYDAINRAKTQGSLFVAAAGNGGSDGVGDNNDTTPHYPSSYDLDNIIAVASTTRTDDRSSFSNYGLKSVDLAAPGSSIYSTLPGNTYGSKSGTSMATPHVSGALSLLLSKEATLTHTQAKERLLSSVDKPNVNGTNPLAGKVASEGRMNTSRLVGGETPDVTPPTVTATSPTSGASGVSRKTSVTATFSEEISPASLTTSTFTLVKDGTTTPAVSATVTLSPDGKKATLTLANNTSLNSRTTYRATVKGGTDGVKDVKGNTLASDKSWTFKTAR